MAVEVRVVQKPRHIFDLNRIGGNWALVTDRLIKGATPILGVDEFVSLVVQTAADKGPIDFIQINGHGSDVGFRIGSDWIDRKTIDGFRERLAKIAPLLNSGSCVEIAACNVGGDVELLRRFSLILGGVPITGYLLIQKGGLPPIGPSVVITPGSSTPPRLATVTPLPPAPPPGG